MEHTENENKDAGAPSGLNVGLGMEPDLESKIDPAYAATWGMKKAACKYEARSMWATGRYQLADNPFTGGTWAHKWWHDEYVECDA